MKRPAGDRHDRDGRLRSGLLARLRRHKAAHVAHDAQEEDARQRGEPADGVGRLRPEHHGESPGQLRGMHSTLFPPMFEYKNERVLALGLYRRGLFEPTVSRIFPI